MKNTVRVRASLLLLGVACASLPSFVLCAEQPYDGRWAVLLVCSDTKDRNGVVKGYDYNFTATIREGVLRAEYGAPGHPASVVYTGTVSSDGTLEIQATGNTGRSDYSVGKVAQGTQYNYTMQGRLEQTRGQATRREVRPCNASFTKL